jgi:hypothetical protein
VAQFSLSAGGSDGVNITTLTFTAAAASVAANFQNLKVMVGFQQLGITQTTLTNGGQMSFSASSPVQIPAGGNVLVDIYASVLSGAETSVSQALVTLTTITAQLATSGSALGTANITGLNTDGQTVTVVGNGAITISSDPSSPIARQVAMGQTGVVLGVLRFQETSNNEAVNLTDLTVTATSLAGTPLNGTASTSASSLKNFVITDNTNSYTKGSWTTAATAGAGTKLNTVTFNNLNFQIPANGTLRLTFKADTNSWASGGASSAQYKIGIAATSTDVTLRGVSSNASINAGLTTFAQSASTTVVRSTVAMAAVGSISSPQVTVGTTGVTSATEVMGIFSVTASNAGDLQINSIDLTHGGSAPSSTINTTYTVFDATGSGGLSTAIGTGIILANGSATTVTFATPVQITAGQTKYFVIKANTALFNTGSGGTTKSYALSMTAWTYTDGITSPNTLFSASSDAGTVTAVFGSSGTGNRTY